MTIAQTIAEKVEQLSPERQQKALEFIEVLSRDQPRGLRGLLKGRLVDMSLEEFQAIRREMWEQSPVSSAHE